MIDVVSSCSLLAVLVCGAPGGGGIQPPRPAPTFPRSAPASPPSVVPTSPPPPPTGGVFGGDAGARRTIDRFAAERDAFIARLDTEARVHEAGARRSAAFARSRHHAGATAVRLFQDLHLLRSDFAALRRGCGRGGVACRRRHRAR
ncbi:MAG: hypothetical protein IPH13_10685 [Planctomycetes bacterium]|nr:hypothetical protein [Planctomycetota bacterium]